MTELLHTDPALVTDAKITDTPRSASVTGYGRKIPTGYMLRYSGRWHRVYMMQYGNSGTPYIRAQGEDLVLSSRAETLVEELAKGVAAPTPQEGK